MSNEPMNDDQDAPLTIRETISANLSQETVDRLRSIIDAQGDAAAFRERLVHILTRYERYKAQVPVLSKNERRQQVKKLHDKANRFLAALDDLHPKVREDIQSTLDNAELSRALESGELSLETSWDVIDHSITQTVTGLSSIIAACRDELNHLDATKGAPKANPNLPLNQLLIDLGSTYEAETGIKDKRMCYRDDVSPDGYSGAFFLMAKTLLDSYEPNCYTSPEALGIRILREPYLKLDPTD